MLVNHSCLRIYSMLNNRLHLQVRVLNPREITLASPGQEERVSIHSHFSTQNPWFLSPVVLDFEPDYAMWNVYLWCVMAPILPQAKFSLYSSFTNFVMFNTESWLNGAHEILFIKGCQRFQGFQEFCSSMMQCSKCTLPLLHFLHIWITQQR